MDFTFNTYKLLLQTLQSQGYAFTTLADFIRSEAKLSPVIEKPASGAAELSRPLGGAGGGAPDNKSNNPQPSTIHESAIRNRQSSIVNPKSEILSSESVSPQDVSEALNPKSEIVNPKLILLRHDVEARYPNALRFAQIQHAMGIRGSYYFRLYPKPRNISIIRSIAQLGHEIGYHYDDLSFCKGNYEQAIHRFEQHIDFLRTLAPVETITMEGAPLSAYDNRALWKKFDYKAYGIIAEPYLDLNFGSTFSQTPNPGRQTSNPFFYLTDTGRRWDGWGASLRDKVPQQDEWIKQGLIFHSTADIISAANKGKLPGHIMMTFHPQRWSDGILPWLKELVLQNAKNIVKYLLVYSKK